MNVLSCRKRLLLSRWRRLLLFGPFILLGPGGEVGGASLQSEDGGGFSVSVETYPDTVLVGQVFHLRVSVRLPGEARPVFPDTVASGPYLESARTVRKDRVGLGAGTVLWTAEYALVAWKSGPLEIPDLSVEVRSDPVSENGDGLHHHLVDSGLVTVSSVLPLQGLSAEPTGPEGPWDPGRPRWSLLMGISLLGVGMLGVLFRREGGERRTSLFPHPGEPGTLEGVLDRALGQLEEVERRSSSREGSEAQVADRLAEILRIFLLGVDPNLHSALTTSELLEALEERLPGEILATLRHILSTMDRVRFGKGEPLEGETDRLAKGVRHWIREAAGLLREEALHG